MDIAAERFFDTRGVKWFFIIFGAKYRKWIFEVAIQDFTSTDKSNCMLN
jgi:hypothetical protein